MLDSNCLRKSESKAKDILVDGRLFREAMSNFASGVTIVTTIDPGGDKHGATISAFCSLSLEPALIQICLSSTSRTLECILRSGVFSVSILRDSQAEAAGIFATPSAYRFSSVGWTPGRHDIPLIDNALAWLECRVDSSVVAGDHTLVVGAVVDVTVSEGDPLVYFRRGYHKL